MSAIQARIHAFESLGQEAPKQPVARKQPIDLYGGVEDESPSGNGEKGTITALSTGDGTMDKRNDDEAHNLVVGSITSDFVKVSPPRSRAPPLPPRKTSETTASTPSTPSVDGDSISYSTTSNFHLKGPPTPKPIPSKARTLGPTTGTNGGLHAYPRNGRGHNHAVSSSSFHSVSLSDHGDGEHDEVEHELGGSYEAVSPHASSVFSLVDRSTSMASSPAMSAVSLGPPALPPRPSTTTPTSDNQQIPVSYAVRKVPPPPSALPNTRVAQGRGHKPPPLDNVTQRNLARSSLTSINTTTTASPSNSSFFSNGKRSSRASTSTVNSSFNLQTMAKKRPPPLPPNARARYDLVFDANAKTEQERRKLMGGKTMPKLGGSSRRAVGWRGTSVDLTTMGAPAEQQSEQSSFAREPPMEEEKRLSGKTVRMIWESSRLPRNTLKTIWNECDPQKTGSLDKQSFANGMWRIDNELLGALSIRTTPSTVSQSTTRSSFTRR